MIKLIEALLAKLFNRTTKIDVTAELKKLKDTRDRLNLAVEQNTDVILEHECNKLELEEELSDAIKDLNEAHDVAVKEEDAKIKDAEKLIDEAQDWLKMFPSK